MWERQGDLATLLAQARQPYRSVPIYSTGTGVGSVVVWAETGEATGQLQWYFTVAADDGGGHTDDRSFATAEGAQQAALNYAIPLFEGIVAHLKAVRNG